MNRFGKLFQQSRQQDDENSNIQNAGLLSTQKFELSDTQTLKKKGRPTGKRSNPEYEQVTAYIKKETHRKVKMALLEQNGGDFSDLVEKLLEDWINNKGG
jgi:hypothetical protein